MTDDAPPTAPESLPNYLADGLPKQDENTLQDARDYIDALLEYRRQPIDTDMLPNDAEPIDEDDADAESGKGTIVKERVKCGDDSCACMSGGEKHGPYLYRYYREAGTLTSEYIGKP